MFLSAAISRVFSHSINGFLEILRDEARRFNDNVISAYSGDTRSPIPMISVHSDGDLVISLSAAKLILFPETFAGKLESFRFMHDSVEAGLRNQLALEHVVPVCDRQLACQYESLPVVPVVDDLLEVVLYLPFEPDHAKVIDDQQVVCGELAEEVGLAPFQMHQPQLLDEHVHREVEHLVALAAGPLSQGADKEGLARARGSFHDGCAAFPNVAA